MNTVTGAKMSEAVFNKILQLTRALHVCAHIYIIVFMSIDFITKLHKVYNFIKQIA